MTKEKVKRSPATNTKAVGQPKHVSIHNALDNLDDAITRLSRLHTQIEGNEDSIPQEVHSELCLSEFLDSATLRIDGLADRVDKEVNEIRSLLF